MSSQIKITFLGAGSTIFLKSLIGDAFLKESLQSAHISLYDIDAERLNESRLVIDALNRTINGSRATVSVHLGPEERLEALRDADFVINAVQVGGYDPATIVDFEIPKKYGLRQTIGDTLGIGGIFRALRTIPVMLDFIRDMENVCPEALLLNYSNPMAMVMGALQVSSPISSVGLCHSVQVCAPDLLASLDMSVADLRWRIAGINHMAWLLDIRDGRRDLYPEIRKRAAAKNAEARHGDMVRFEMMKYFDYYVTESSEHFAEYTPYWIRRDNPELIDRFAVPLDEYPRRCLEQIADWTERRNELTGGGELGHEKTHEYGADIMNAVCTGEVFRFHGNILNTPGYIANLPRESVVEVPCLADGNGIQGVHVGDLPPQCAALNRTNVNVQTMTIRAALEQRRSSAYQAALLDPHTAAELAPEQIIALCDELFDAHREWLPEYS